MPKTGGPTGFGCCLDERRTNALSHDVGIDAQLLQPVYRADLAGDGVTERAAVRTGGDEGVIAGDEGNEQVQRAGRACNLRIAVIGEKRACARLDLTKEGNIRLFEGADMEARRQARCGQPSKPSTMTSSPSATS